MDIYRLRLSLWVGPQGVPQFYERRKHLHVYGSATTWPGSGTGVGVI